MIENVTFTLRGLFKGASEFGVKAQNSIAVQRTHRECAVHEPRVPVAGATAF